jgi:hypothetical protein
MKSFLWIVIALICFDATSSAQIGWTFAEYQKAHGQNPVSWWHKENVRSLPRDNPERLHPSRS